MSENRKLIRKKIKAKLQNLAPKARVLAAQNIATKIINSEIFIHSQNIACYAPIKNEINTWPIIKNIWEQGKNCYLPACYPEGERKLCFVQFLLDDRLLEMERYGVLVPEITPKKTIALQDLDLVIIPLLGFTDTRFRLGRGAGYYDYTFAFKKQTALPIKPYLIGVGYECQRVEFMPQSWDVMMDEIVVG